ncbi:MAG: hypothetical protein QOE60_971 [Thermoleophilaceae bacterium]|nr:hypothetical protein [Thermoleophilaceae bacterium]
MAERSAAEQLKALVEAAEREARESREALGRVAERADELLRRVDELSAEVAEAAAELKREIETLRGDVPPPAEDPGTRVEPDADDELIAEAEAVAGRKPDVGAAEAPAPEAPAPEAPAPEAPAVPEGARLLALKMALDGRPREDTAGYLRENFELEDPEALLDEVYSRAEPRK